MQAAESECNEYSEEYRNAGNGSDVDECEFICLRLNTKWMQVNTSEWKWMEVKSSVCTGMKVNDIEWMQIQVNSS